MNIGINNNEYYSGNSARSVGNNESLGNVQTTVPKGEFDVSSLRTGQTLSGEVVNLENGNVTIKLDNGQTINARLDGNAGISVGQLISFEVNSKSNSNLVELRPLFSNLAVNNTISTALKAAGLALTSANISMTQTMMEEGMSIDRNALLQMARQVNSYPAADPASIVKMDKLGMAINELNVTQYENYRNFEHQIIDNVKDMSGEYATVLSDSVALADKNNIDLATELLSLIDDSLLSDESIPTGATALLTKEGMILNGDSTTSVISNSDIGLDEVLTADVISNNLSEELIDTDSKEMAAIKNFLPELKDLISSLGKNVPDFVSAQDAIAVFKDAIEQYKAAGNNLDGNSFATDSAFGDKIYDALKNITSNDSFKEFLSDALKSQFTLTPDKIGKEGEIERLYERILKTSSKLMNISSGVGELSNIAQNAQSINDNVNFMNELNQFVNYVQLPLKMAQENAHGELYVYSNKKNLASKDGNLTALLHLDMEHLGPMDVYVSMKGFENVNTHFYMQSDELLDFIADNIHILDERLTAKGYNMTSSVSKKDPSGIRPITEEFLKETPEDAVRTVATIGFDVRA